MQLSWLTGRRVQKKGMYRYLGIIFRAILPLLLTPPLYPQSTELRFQDLTIADGLSSNTVKCILQDSRGFMWFGTPNGLNKYDGYRFTVYRNEPHTPNEASCMEILSIFEDSDGDIWVGTKYCGTFIYDREKDRVERLVLKKDSAIHLNSYNVRSIYEDSGGLIWVGTEDGLYAVRKETGDLVRYQHQSHYSTSLSHSTIYSNMT